MAWPSGLVCKAHTVGQIFDGVRDRVQNCINHSDSREMPVEEVEGLIVPASSPDKNVVSSGKEPQPGETCEGEKTESGPHEHPDLVRKGSVADSVKYSFQKTR